MKLYKQFSFLIMAILLASSTLNASLTIKEILGENHLEILKRTKSDSEIMEIARDKYNKLKALNYSDKEIKKFSEVFDRRQKRANRQDD